MEKPAAGREGGQAEEVAIKSLDIQKCFTAAGAPMILFDIRGVGRCWSDFHGGWIDDGYIALRTAEGDLAEYLEGGFSQDPVLVALCRMWAADQENNAPAPPRDFPVPTPAEAEAFNASWRRLTDPADYASPRHLSAKWAAVSPDLS